jgi:hypothetical protein
VPKTPTKRTVTTAECQFQTPDRGKGGRKPENELLLFMIPQSSADTYDQKALQEENGERSSTRLA